MTSQSIKPNKSTIWFDRFVMENKEEFIVYRDKLDNLIIKKIKKRKALETKKWFKFKSLKKYD
jgi:hypothetical protein